MDLVFYGVRTLAHTKFKEAVVWKLITALILTLLVFDLTEFTSFSLNLKHSEGLRKNYFKEESLVIGKVVPVSPLELDVSEMIELEPKGVNERSQGKP